jgi:hypothetical protein
MEKNVLDIKCVSTFSVTFFNTKIPYIITKCNLVGLCVKYFFFFFL